MSRRRKTKSAVSVEEVKVVCLSCKSQSKKLYLRGLCRDCWEDKGVRCQHDPIRRGSVSRGIGLDNSRSTLPAKPIQHLPDSDEWLEEMRGRVMRGESLHHPDDASNRSLD